MDQLTVFGQVTALNILQHIFRSYGAIEKINLEKNAFKMMDPYEPSKTLDRIIDQLKEGWYFSILGG